MPDIPTINGHHTASMGMIRVLATDGVGVENLEPLNLYYQPGATLGSNDGLYRQPQGLSDRPEGDLYFVPA